MNRLRLHIWLVAIAVLITAGARAQKYIADTTYQLPDVLITQSGKKIANKADWEKIRRPEILKLFEENVQGKTPAKKPPEVCYHFH
ncbi:MAG: hypothetical protein KF746_13720 [Chitinophagaceae bacterium]|nr:hypothetical protein [Chitinophagaceae bacterium]